MSHQLVAAGCSIWHAPGIDERWQGLDVQGITCTALTSQWALHNNQAKVGPSAAGRREGGFYPLLVVLVGSSTHGASIAAHSAYVYTPWTAQPRANFNYGMNYSGCNTGRQLSTIQLLKRILLTSLGDINGHLASMANLKCDWWRTMAGRRGIRYDFLFLTFWNQCKLICIWKELECPLKAVGRRPKRWLAKVWILFQFSVFKDLFPRQGKRSSWIGWN